MTRRLIGYFGPESRVTQSEIMRYVLFLSALFMAANGWGQSLVVPSTANEGAEVTITYREVTDMFFFSDEVVINFGDGTVITNSATGRTALLTWHHTYADDSGFTTYVVTVTEEDPEVGLVETSRGIRVVNVAPQASLAADYSVTAGRLTASVPVDDPGRDIVTGQVSYGDGSIQNFDLGFGRTIFLNHTYTNAGNHTLSVMVRDDDGAIWSGTAQVTVPGTVPPPSLSIHSFAGVVITGELGRSYDIQKTDSAESTNWTTVASVTLSTNPQLWMDMESTNSPTRFYRAIAR
jgi:hypothetical protein